MNSFIIILAYLGCTLNFVLTPRFCYLDTLLSQVQLLIYQDVSISYMTSLLIQNSVLFTKFVDNIFIGQVSKGCKKWQLKCRA